MLPNRHQNFKNWFRNSWDNWRQSCHPQHQNYFFCLWGIVKCQFLNDGCHLWPQISKSIFKILVPIMLQISWSLQNSKKQSGSNIVGHPVIITSTSLLYVWLKDMILFEYLNLKCVSFIAMNRTPWCDDEMGTDELTVGNDI